MVSGGFHPLGGQSKANAALADYLARLGRPIHLVGHDIDPCFLARPGVTVHIVPRPGGRDIMGWLPLEQRARRVAAAVTADDPHALVVVNGGNLAGPHVNWVHCVHHAWGSADRDAPLWFRLKNRLFKWWAHRRERRAVRAARLVIANSAQTRDHLIRRLGIDPGRIQVVHLGADPAWAPPTEEERSLQRRRLGIAGGRPVVLFAGALSHDNNKGFDTLLASWRSLAARGDWDAQLLVAGAGNGLARWRRLVSRERLGGSIEFLGFSRQFIELLAAADLLVSPVRYEAYGMNVQEAVCRGVPTLVSSRAGVVERFPSELSELVLPDPEDAEDLARRLLAWRTDQDGWRERFRPLSDAFRSYSWEHMASRIVELVEGADRGATARPTACYV